MNDLADASTSMAPSKRPPHLFPKRILACVIGLTPQIVTETLYALVAEQEPPFVPAAIHVATTRQGKERLTRVSQRSFTRGTSRVVNSRSALRKQRSCLPTSPLYACAMDCLRT